MTAGWFPLGRIAEVPIRVHFSTPLVCLLFTGMSFEPIRWVGVLTVILVHELGHAAVVRKVGAQPIGIDIHGFGGFCWWRGDPTPLERSFIAWGGVLAQAALLIVAIAIGARFEPAESTPLGQLLVVLVASNAGIALLNLLPVYPFDGREAWQAVPLLLRKLRRKRSPPRRPGDYLH